MIYEDEPLSRIANVLEKIGTAINNTQLGDEIPFQDVPVFWDMVEVSANTMPETCIVFSCKDFGGDATDCLFERQLDIGIIHNTDYPREITLRLSKYAEDLKLIIDQLILHTNEFELKFVQGSEIGYLRNNRDDAESYKGTKTLFSSIIILSYNLRY